MKRELEPGRQVGKPTMTEDNPAPTASLYTELPFPGHGVVRRTSSKVLLTGLREHAPELLEREGLRSVDIGCGTGEKTAGIVKPLKICGNSCIKTKEEDKRRAFQKNRLHATNTREIMAGNQRRTSFARKRGDYTRNGIL